MVDFYALCVDLARVADALDGRTPLTSNQGQALDGYSALAEFRHVADRARAALTAPAPEGPTDEELTQFLFDGFRGPIEFICDAEEEAHVMIRNHVKFAQAVLARWGTSNLAEIRSSLGGIPTPVPSDKGEIGKLATDELVRRLRTKAATEKANRCHYSAILLTRAADILEQRHPAPVPVSERLPEPSAKVLAHYFNALGKGRTVCAIWVPAKTRKDNYGDNDFTEYDEETDEFYWPEGWYEAIENWEELGWVKVYEGEVAFWQPLPKWPAMPLPAGGVTNG